MLNNISEIEFELFNGNTIIDKIIDEDKIKNYFNNLKNKKTRKASISKQLVGGRGKQNWLNTRSDENLFRLINKCKLFFHFFRNLITQDPFFPPQTPLFDYIINIIRLRKLFKNVKVGYDI